MQPIIIIGMHRSGSSLLVKVLQELGVFMGNDFEENNESMFFNKINDWLLSQAGASWDCPENFNHLSNDFKDLMVEIVQRKLKNTYLKKYLGSSYRSIYDSSFIWGWKDPRNTFTIDVWKEIFTKPKVIHIYRNPVDVINSLTKRETSKITVTGNPTRTGIKKWFYGYRLPKKRLFYHSFKSLNFTANFDLWKTYTNKAFNMKKEGGTEVLHISFENLIEKPEIIIKKIVEFCNLKVDERNHKDFLQTIDKTRKFAFVKNAELVEFYKTIKNDKLITRLGFGDIVNE